MLLCKGACEDMLQRKVKIEADWVNDDVTITKEDGASLSLDAEDFMEHDAVHYWFNYSKAEEALCRLLKFLDIDTELL